MAVLDELLQSRCCTISIPSTSLLGLKIQRGLSTLKGEMMRAKAAMINTKYKTKRSFSTG